jgi:hypothetical protein
VQKGNSREGESARHENAIGRVIAYLLLRVTVHQQQCGLSAVAANSIPLPLLDLGKVHCVLFLDRHRYHHRRHVPSQVLIALVPSRFAPLRRPLLVDILDLNEAFGTPHPQLNLPSFPVKDGMRDHAAQRIRRIEIVVDILIQPL